MHWNLKYVMMPTLLSLVTLQVAIATYSATSDNKVGIMTTLGFQLMEEEYTLWIVVV